MRQRPHYRLPADQGGSGRVFLWLFIGLVLGIIGFVWWHSGKSKSTPPVAQTPAPPARRVVVVTNSPPVSRRAAPTTLPPSNPPPAVVVPAPTNSGKVISPPLPPAGAVGFPRPPRDTLEVQIALARRAISSGSIDGVNGSQTRAALLAFQRANDLSPTGELGPATRSVLLLESPPLTSYTISSNDLARLQPISPTWLGKSQQSALDYETLLELVAELGHASPTLTRKLNPGVTWTNVPVGTEVTIPAVAYPSPKTKAAFVVIALAERRLQAFDEQTNLLAHFPCSIAAKFEKRPVGELHVRAVAPNPDYTFNPEVFPESPEAQQLKTKLILPPGPNNPVGTAWISLDRPGYGMHGTPSPEQVGRTESHGCFRLANWNAEYLIKLVWVGMPVWVEP